MLHIGHKEANTYNLLVMNLQKALSIEMGEKLKSVSKETGR